MATQLNSPNPSSDNNLTNSESTQAALNDGQAAPDRSLKNAQTSVFVNSQPTREDQVENAIKFLSHPRVRGSTVFHRRNFLEQKGLTKEEIDEAFRRVPVIFCLPCNLIYCENEQDPSPAATSGQTSTQRDVQAVTTTNTIAQAPLQAMTDAPSGVTTQMTRRFHWSHAVFAIGFLAISGVGTVIVLKNSVIPRLKTWIRRVVLDEEDSLERKSVGKPSLAEEAAAKAAAVAAADVAKASQEMLITKNEDHFSYQVQIHEMRTVRNAIANLEGKSNIAARNISREEYLDGSFSCSMQAANILCTVRSVSPPAAVEPSHPKSFAEYIDDRPPNLNQPISNPNMAPRSKPWEATHPAGYSVQDNGVTYALNKDSSVPLWQHKSTRITEIENRDDHKFVTGSNDTAVVERPPVCRWVPPQPPPVSMPEAAIAIRQPKSLVPKDGTFRADVPAQPVSGLEELQRITEIAESGGQVEMNGGIGSSDINNSEMRELLTEV